MRTRLPRPRLGGAVEAGGIEGEGGEEGGEGNRTCGGVSGMSMGELGAAVEGGGGGRRRLAVAAAAS